MIIKGERVSSSRAPGPLVDHLLRGEENDAVTLLQGTESDSVRPLRTLMLSIDGSPCAISLSRPASRRAAGMG